MLSAGFTDPGAILSKTSGVITFANSSSEGSSGDKFSEQVFRLGILLLHHRQNPVKAVTTPAPQRYIHVGITLDPLPVYDKGPFGVGVGTTVAVGCCVTVELSKCMIVGLSCIFSIVGLGVDEAVGLGVDEAVDNTDGIFVTCVSEGCDVGCGVFSLLVNVPVGNNVAVTN